MLHWGATKALNGFAQTICREIRHPGGRCHQLCRRLPRLIHDVDYLLNTRDSRITPRLLDALNDEIIQLGGITGQTHHLSELVTPLRRHRCRLLGCNPVRHNLASYTTQNRTRE